LDVFFPGAKVTEMAGLAHKVDGGVVFPILHPNAVLHRPQNRRDFELQVKALASYLSGDVKARRIKPNYKDLTNSAFFRGNRGANILWAYDFETTGLDPKKDELRCVSFADRPNTAQYTSKCHEINCPEFWTRNRFIAHNSKFESRFTRSKYGVTPNIVGDTFIAHHLLFEDESHHLDILERIFTSLGGSKDESNDWLRRNNNAWDKIPADILMRRNCSDSDATLRIHNILYPEICKQGLKYLYESISVPAATVVGKMEDCGMYVNPNTLKKIYTEEEAKAASIKKQICERWGIDDINFRSPKQMIKLVYETMMAVGLSGKVGMTKSGQPSTDSDVFEIMMSKPENERIKDDLQLILDCRSALYNCTKIDEIFKWRRDDGTVSADNNVAYTPTGRLTSSRPNLQNLPVDGRVKLAFESRWEGGNICEADYGQLELRLIGSESRCRDLIEAYKDGRDIHQETADKFNMERVDAKRVNFACAYGVGPSTLSRELKVEFEDARFFLGEKNKQWWQISTWREIQHNRAREQGYVTNRFGRRKRLPNILSKVDKERFAAERVAGNFPIQSLGADTLMLAMVIMDRYITEMKLKSLIINQVHDSIILDVYPGEEEVIKELIPNVMVKEIMGLHDWYKIPLVVDCKIAKTWGG